MTTTNWASEIASPLGPILLVSDGERLGAVLFESYAHAPRGMEECRRDRDLAVLREAARQLGEYFHEGRREFDLPLAPAGTAFQLRVWEEIARIPYGSTTTYGRLADLVGRPAAARAVGAATGRNPLGVVVPCHRVVGSDGSLTGYGGGLPRKTALLAHEGRGGRSDWRAGPGLLPGLE